MFVPLYIRPEIFIIIGFHILLPELEQLLIVLGSEDVSEMVLLAVNSVFSIIQHPSQCLGACLAGILAGLLQRKILQSACRPQKKVGNQFVFSTHKFSSWEMPGLLPGVFHV